MGRFEYFPSHRKETQAGLSIDLLVAYGHFVRNRLVKRFQGFFSGENVQKGVFIERDVEKRGERYMNCLPHIPKRWNGEEYICG
jgi:hypothetical protein